MISLNACRAARFACGLLISSSYLPFDLPGLINIPARLGLFIISGSSRPDGNWITIFFLSGE